VILEEGPNEIMRKAGRIIGLVGVDNKLIAIVPVESIIGSNPHKAFVILQKTRDSGRRKALIGCEVMKLDTRRLCPAMNEKTNLNMQTKFFYKFCASDFGRLCLSKDKNLDNLLEIV
jgi:hypothetical protein